MIFETPFWWWDGVLPNDLCDLIIAEGDKLVSGDGRVGGGDNSAGTVDKKIRETNISFFDSSHWIEGLCVHYAMLANRNSGWNITIDHPQPVQYARYFPDQHYSPHRDDYIKNTQNNMMRKLSVSIQVTDPENYEGGDFIIEAGHNNEFDKLVQFRKRGSVIVFPSLVKHGVEPVLKGVRHSVVCWIEGPKFR